jgi:hypothetical protein
VCHHDMERDKWQLLTVSLLLPGIPVTCVCDQKHNSKIQVLFCRLPIWDSSALC